MIAIATGLFLFPVYWTATMAFKPEGEWEFFGSHTFWFPHEWTLDNFRLVFGHPPTNQFLDVTTAESVWPAVTNSLLSAGGGTLIALCVGTLAAYGIVRFRAGGRRLPYAILLIRIFPPLTLLIPLFFLWFSLGLFDSRLGLILLYGGVTFPFAVWLMRGFLASVPRELVEAAIVDGCTQWGALRKAVLPLVKTGLATTAFFIFILNWSDLQIALMLSQDHAKTATVFLQSFSTKAGNLYGPQAALAVLLVVPPALLGVLIRRHLIRGLTFGAIAR